MSKQLTYGAAMRYTISQLGGFVADKESVLTVLGSDSAKQVVQQNPDRVGLTIINTGAGDVFVFPASSAFPTVGIRCFNSGGGVSLNVRDDFILPSLEWRCSGAGTTSALFVIEFFIAAMAQV